MKNARVADKQAQRSSHKESSSRLVWVEGIRVFAAVMVLLYHAQLLFTDYGYTPQPTGLIDNLGRIAYASDRLGPGILGKALSVPIWFGYQAVDLFILLSGFTTVLSLKGRPLEPVQFLRRRFTRVLFPYWTIAWCSYPILWLIGRLTNRYSPDPWNMFTGAVFPLLFEFDGEQLLAISGPWWFVPLILSFILIFPLLWKLLHRWGARRLLLVSLGLTIAYRAMAVYWFGGHPTYVVFETRHDWLPFVPFLARLSSFVVGMVLAQGFLQGRGVLFWRLRRVVLLSSMVYAIGWLCQFSRFGWIFADLLLPIGLAGLCYAICRWLQKSRLLEAAMGRLGRHTYSFFLIHNFVIDRTIHLSVGNSLPSYSRLLPLLVVGTLILSVLADYTTPLIQQLTMAFLRSVDHALIPASGQQQAWGFQVGDRVRYGDEGGWTILQVGRLLDGKRLYLCQSDYRSKTQWVTQQELELDKSSPGEKSHHNLSARSPTRGQM